MRHFIYFTTIFVLIAAFAPSFAGADIKVVSAMWLDQNEWQSLQQSLSPEERARLAQNGPLFRYGGAHMTLYESGPLARVDTPDFSVLVNKTSSQTTVLDYEKKLSIVADHLPRRDYGNHKASIQRTGQTMVIRGHTAHRYLISIHDSSLNIDADDWVAEDVTIDNTVGASNDPLMQSIWGHIKGLPLWSTIVITHGDRTLTVNYEVESISTKQLPPSTFAVPTGFRKVTLPDNAPVGQGGDPGNGLAFLGGDGRKPADEKAQLGQRA